MTGTASSARWRGHLLTLLILLLPFATAAERPPSATPEALTAWDAQLYDQVQVLVKAGKGPGLHYLGAGAYIDAADAAGRIELRLADSAVFLQWPQLGWPARVEVARDVARITGETGLPLLAFHLLADGQTDEGERLMTRLPIEQQERIRNGLTTPPPVDTPIENRPAQVTARGSEPFNPPPPLQFLLFDAVAVHTEDGQTMGPSGFGHKPTYTRHQDIPPDWSRPVDFLGGSHYIRYEVLEKPNLRKVHFCAVLSTPMGAKNKQDLPSHPGSPDFTVPGVEIEQGLFTAGFKKTYQGKPWAWPILPVRFWEDTYRFGSKQYGPSSVFPLKVRLTMHLVAKGATYHPYGNVGGVDFRTLRQSSDCARELQAGHIGAALVLAQRARSAESAWVAAALSAHAEARWQEIEEYWHEEPDCASDEAAMLAAEYAGSDLGRKLAGQAQAMERHQDTVRARQARTIWRKVLETSNRIVVPDGLGDEAWNAPVSMPGKLQATYAKELLAIRTGVGQVLQLVNGRNWTRMARALLHNLGQPEP